MAVACQQVAPCPAVLRMCIQSAAAAAAAPVHPPAAAAGLPAQPLRQRNRLLLSGWSAQWHLKLLLLLSIAYLLKLPTAAEVVGPGDSQHLQPGAAAPAQSNMTGQAGKQGSRGQDSTAQKHWQPPFRALQYTQQLTSSLPAATRPPPPSLHHTHPASPRRQLTNRRRESHGIRVLVRPLLLSIEANVEHTQAGAGAGQPGWALEQVVLRQVQLLWRSSKTCLLHKRQVWSAAAAAEQRH